MFSLFPTRFSTLSKANTLFEVHLILRLYTIWSWPSLKYVFMQIIWLDHFDYCGTHTMITHREQSYKFVWLTLSQTTNFRLFHTERVCRRQFEIWWKWKKVLKMVRKLCGGKEKLLIMSNFSFSHSVFKWLVLQTRKKQSLFGKGLTSSCCKYN